jgi:hypothetical protein
MKKLAMILCLILVAQSSFAGISPDKMEDVWRCAKMAFFTGLIVWGVSIGSTYGLVTGTYFFFKAHEAYDEIENESERGDWAELLK